MILSLINISEYYIFIYYSYLISFHIYTYIKTPPFLKNSIGIQWWAKYIKFMLVEHVVCVLGEGTGK